MPDDNNSRNTIIFVVISLVLLTVYQFTVIGPNQKLEDAARAKQQQQAAAIATQSSAVAGVPASAASVLVPRAQALTQNPRVPIAARRRCPARSR